MRRVSTRITRAVPPAKVASVLAVATFTLAAVNLIAVVPLRWAPHVLVSPTSVERNHDGRVALLLVGIGLVFLANQLRKQKRRAWQVAVVLAAIAALVHLLRPHDHVATAVSLTVFAGLLAARRTFDVAGDRLSVGRCVRVGSMYFGAVVVYGLVMLWVMRNNLDPDPTFTGMLRTVISGLVGADGAYEYSRSFWPALFELSLVLLGTAGGVIVAVMLFRPYVHRHRHDPGAYARARDLVERFGDGTLSYFALRDGKTHFFSSDGRAMIAYCYRGGYALASGDPVGHRDSIALVVDEFLAMCAEHGWGVAVLAAREQDAEMYASRGLHAYYLGDEAIVDCERFSLVGRQIRKVRQSVHRLEKAGYTFEIIDAARAANLSSDFARVTRKWQGKAPDRGFTMALGRFAGADDGGCLVAVARDDGGVARGFLHLVPFGGDSPGYSLDAMRRDPDSPNGLMEYMVVECINDLRARGASRLSLNFAAFARLLHADADLSAFQRLQRWVVLRFNPYFQIESLYAFNRKFLPEWQSRCVYYDDRWNAVRVGVLYGEVETLVHIPPLRRLVTPSVPRGRASRRRAAHGLPAGAD